MSKKLMEVRDRFSKFLNNPGRLNAPSRDIASSFLALHRSSISAEAWDDVTITGLVHMMDGLRKRRRFSDGSEPMQDLFAGFGVEPIVVVRVPEDGKGVVEKNKDLPSLTLPEALDCLARHTKERVANTKRAREWRRLITRVRPFMTKEGMTLGEAMKLAEAADAAKRKNRARGD